MQNLKINDNSILCSDNKITITLPSLSGKNKILNAVLKVKLDSSNQTIDLSNYKASFKAIKTNTTVFEESDFDIARKLAIENGFLIANIALDLQTAFNKYAKKCELSFGAISGSTPIKFDLTAGVNDINLSYTSYLQYQKFGMTKSLALNNASLDIDLYTGELNTHTNLLSANVNNLSYNLSAYFNSEYDNKYLGMPKGWRLNLHQFLKRNLAETSTPTFDYLDVNGKIQSITERYFYIADNATARTYVQKADITTDQNGKLWYGNYEVFPAHKTSGGLSFVSTLKDVRGANLIDYEPDELVQTKEAVAQLTESIAEIKNTIENARKQFCIYALSKKTLSKQTGSEETDETITNDGFIENLNTALSILNNSADDLIKDKTLTDLGLNDYYNVLFANQTSVKLSTKDILSCDMQIKESARTIIIYSKKLNEYETKLKKMQHKQDLLDMQVPIYYLHDGKTFYGFGRTSNQNLYRLNLITDLNNNRVLIVYKAFDSDKIDYLLDSEGKQIKFKYSTSGKLNTIISNNGETIKFTNDANKLQFIENSISKINVKYFYDNELRLSALIDSYGLGYELGYDNNDKLISFNKLSMRTTINYGTSDFNIQNLKRINDYVLKNELVKISYNYYNKTTSIKDSKGKSLNYVFDNNGNLTTVYEGNIFSKSAKNVNLIELREYTENQVKILKPISRSGNLLKDVLSEEDGIEPQSAMYAGNTEASDVSEGYDNNVKSNCSIIMPANQDFIKNYAISSNAEDKINACISETNFYVALVSLIKLDPYDFKRPDKVELGINYKFNGKDCSKSFNLKTYTDQWQLGAVSLDVGGIWNINCYLNYNHGDQNEGEVVFTPLDLRIMDCETINYDDEDRIIYKEHNHFYNSVSYEYDLETGNVTKEKAQYFDYLVTKNYLYDSNNNLVKVITSDGKITENVYNDKGVLIESFEYHKDEPTSKLVTKYLTDDKGRQSGETNDFGEQVATYEYDLNGNIRNTIFADGSKLAYGYGQDGKLIETSMTVDGEDNKNTFKYNVGLLTQVSHNGFNVTYGYDNKDRLSSIIVGGHNYYAKFAYNEAEQKTTTTLASGDVFENIENDNGQTTFINYKKVGEYNTIKQLAYDNYNYLQTEIDNLANYTTTYEYDNYGNVTKMQNNLHGKQNSITNEYFEASNFALKSSSIVVNGKTLNYDYLSSPKSLKKILSITLPNGESQDIRRDRLGRIKETQIYALIKQIKYEKVGDYTSNLISAIEYSNFDFDNLVYKENEKLAYKYDKQGNISEIRQNNNLIARYAYDGLNRLVREDNKIFNKTILVAYDAGGNIVSKNEYDYTLTETLENELVSTYKYDMLKWKDQLVEFSYTTTVNNNGNLEKQTKTELFKYDDIGNPLKYRNKTLQWKYGRQLIKYDDIEYKYNANGIRTSKIIKEDGNKITINFFLNGNKILCQTDNKTTNGKTLYFHYGVDGLAGFNYNGVEYLYKKNAQNDIIGICDINGEQIVKYYYDAYGNFKIFVKNNANFLDIEKENGYNVSYAELAKVNPFRYRSYYYDNETGLYYLNSRYYDPQIGRFINADDVSVLDVTKIALNGLNLYAYCLNNPVNHIDENGYIIWFFIVAVAVSALISMGAEVASQVVENDGDWSKVNVGQVLWSGLMGGLSGALMASGIGSVGLAVLGGALGFVNSVGYQLIGGSGVSEINWLSVGVSTLAGALPGIIGRTGASNYSVTHNALKKSDAYAKAATSYDKVLTKIANGEYKNLAGAAGARYLTSSKLQSVMNSVNARAKWSALEIKLLINFIVKGIKIF